MSETGHIDCPCWQTGVFQQVPCPWHDGKDKYPFGAYAAWLKKQRAMILTPKQARVLSSLIGQYQGVLENDIECELIHYVSGEHVEPNDPEIRARLQRDRRRWRKCEDFQMLLQPGPHVPTA